MSEGGVTIKIFLAIHIMAFGLIFGIAYVATDDPHGSPVKSIKTKINRHQSLTDSRARQPNRSPGAIDRPDFDTDRTRLLKHKRSSSDFAAGKWGQLHRRQSINGVEEKFTLANGLREVTAYNVGDPDQNYGDPCESANGEDICAALDTGSKRCAANFVPFGTLLYIAHYGVCTVTDRMNKRYTDRVDIAMKKNEKKKALRFGLKRLKVTVLVTRDG
jgi:3D (Asp-Asp-Asp) domain-containing protein